MNSSLSELKATLFSILEGAFVSPDIQATQQLGVSLSNAVKRDNGVMIIQSQNVEVYSRIVPSIVRSIKLCDSIADSFVPTELPPPIEIKQIESNPIEACCSYLFGQGIGWEAMQDLIKARYLEFITKQFPTRVEAARFLGIQPSYMSKLTHNKPKEGGATA